jgi:copper chaperone CopZ
MITRLQIDGMMCTRCVEAVFTSLTPVEGITRAEVWIGGAEIEHDGRASEERLREAIAVSGYRVSTARQDRRRLPLV